MIRQSLFVMLLTLSLGGGPALADRITVAVAANFLTTAQDIAAAFSAQTGHEVALAHGSTGKIFAQINAGAPFDVFLSADEARPALLEAAGKAAPGGRKTYAIGTLAFVHGASTPPGDLGGMLGRAGLRLAIADPKIAPYGIAARQVLELFRGDDWARDLVYGDSVGQAFAFVATGNAGAGFVALSQARSYQGEIWVLEVPGDLYDPIRQDAVLLKRAEGKAAARAFFAFLDSDFAHQIMQSAGYGVPQ